MSFWTRQGAAFGAGVPAGAAFDVAASTAKDTEAASVGTAFQQASTPSLSAIQSAPNAFGVTPVQSAAYTATHANDLNTDVGSTLLGKGFAWLNKYVWSPGNDGIEALARAADDNNKTFGTADYNPFSALAAEWHVARTQNNTAGQVAWSQFNPNSTIKVPIIGKNGKVSGYKTEQRRYWDDEAKRWVYPLLDDPAQQLAQDQYFKGGTQRWITGASDFVVSTVTDPTLIAGKVTKPIRLARETVTAGDAEKAYAASFKPAGWAQGVEATEDNAKIATVTGKARALQKQVHNVAFDMASTLENGDGIAKFAKDPLIAQTADSGGILAMSQHAVNLGGSLEDKTMRIKRVLFAGAGSKKAYDDLAAESPRLALELDSVTSPNTLLARHDVYAQDMSHADRLKILDDDDQLKKVNDAYREQIDARVAHLAEAHAYDTSLARVKNVGTLGTGEFDEASKGGINRIQTPGLLGQRVVSSKLKALGSKSVEHAYTQKISPFLPPIHYFSGTSMPGFARLDAPDFLDKFEAFAYNNAKYAKRTGNQDLLNVIQDAREKAAMSRSGISGDVGLSRDQRFQAVQQIQKAVRDDIIDRWDAKSNLSREEIGSMLDGLMERRDAEITRAVDRARQSVAAGTSLVLHDEEGLKVLPDAIRDELDKINLPDPYVAARDVARPVSTSQFQRIVGLTDFNHLDKSMFALNKSGVFQPAVRAGMAVGHGASMAMDMLSDYWKFGVLLRPVAYLVRNQLDTQARVDAEIGSMAHGLMAMNGMKNVAFNDLTRVSRIDAAQFMQRVGLHNLVEQADNAIRFGELDEVSKASWQAAKDEAEARLSMSTDEFRQAMIDEHGGTLPAELQGKVLRRRSAAKMIQGTRFQMGAGGQAIDTSGRLMAVYDNLDDYMKKTDQFNAESTFLGYFSDNTAQSLTSRRLKREGTGTYQSLSYNAGSKKQATKWTEAYLAFVNHQLRNDTVNRMIMQGSTDKQILGYLNTEGRDYWAAFKKNARGNDRYASPQELIQAMRNNLDLTIPDIQARQTLLARDLTNEDVGGIFKNAERPMVPSSGRRDVFVDEPTLAQIKSVRGRYFEIFSSLPESIMGRHPLYMAYMKSHLADAAARFDKQGIEKLSLDQVYQIRRQADALARKDLSRVVFDTTRKTPFQQSTRWLFPFYGAWQDTLLKWARIQGDNPEAVPGLLHAFTIPSRVFQVQDDNGNIVRANGDVVDPVSGEVISQNYDPLSGHWVIGLPKAIADATGAKNIKLNRNSLNVIFQGEPFWLPGPGPVVTIGVNEIAQRVMPELFNVDPAQFMNNPVTKWAAPFGLTDQSTSEQSMPQWFNTLSDLFAHDDNWKTHFNEQMYSISNQIARGDLPKMSYKEIKERATNQTRNWFLLRLLGTQSPVSTTPDDALDFYRDRYHAYLNTYSDPKNPSAARDKFMADYPEFGEATISTTVNTTGINATIKAQKYADKYTAAIDKNPKYGWAIVGPENLQGFDSNVYTEQKALGWRKLQDPREALDAQQADKGWQTYNAFIVKMNQALVDQGFTSLRQVGAEGIAQAKQDFIDDLERKNPAWKNSFAAAGAGDSQVQFLDAMIGTVKDYPKLGQREDFAQLQTYLAARKQMRKVMNEEGVHTLSSTTLPDGTIHYADSAGGELAQQWDSFYNDLYDKSSIVAKAMFDRARLSDDDLSEGVSD